MPALIFSAAVALIYTADRTGFWLKEQKQFDPFTFTFLCLSCLAVGLITVNRGDKDLGFLNREQTDEWKGWMQSLSYFHIVISYIYVSAFQLLFLYITIWAHRKYLEYIIRSECS